MPLDQYVHDKIGVNASSLLCGKLRSPHLGNTTAAASVALPIPTTVCSVLLCPDNGMAASVCSVLLCPDNGMAATVCSVLLCPDNGMAASVRNL